MGAERTQGAGTPGPGTALRLAAATAALLALGFRRRSDRPDPTARAERRDAAAAGGSFLAFCRDHPLVVAGVGIALGGLLGAALPSRKSEDRRASEPAPEKLPDVRETSEPESSVVPAAPSEAGAV